MSAGKRRIATSNGQEEQNVQRSELIRQRRTASIRKPPRPMERQKRKATPPASPRKPALAPGPRKPPPVVSRYSVSGLTQPDQRRYNKKFRRRLDVPLRAPGVEVRLPALPEVRLGWRILSFVLVVGLSFVLYQLYNSPAYRVQAAEVHGLQRVTIDEVEYALEVSGLQVFAVNSNDVRENLLTEFPEFTSAEVQVSFPNSVIITVTERIPVLIWKQDGRIDFVDNEGIAFPVRVEAEANSLPRVESAGDPPALAAIIPSLTTLSMPAPTATSAPLLKELLAPSEPQAGVRPLLSSQMVQAILLLARQAPQGSPLRYHPEHGLGWVDGRGWDVYFGDVQSIEMKLLVYQAILARLENEKVMPVMVSVEYVHAPYFRLEK